MPEFLSAEILLRFLGVLGIDLILSGDNAVVIALAVRRLEGKTRRRAIFWGAVGAVGMRLVFAAIVTYLLIIPFLQALAALLLVWIAWRLLFQHEEHSDVEAGTNIWGAIKIIIVADLIMSLDNVVALVGVSGGNLWLLVFGLLLTIPLIIYGSQILSSLMDRMPWLVYLGSGILVYVAVEMFLEDKIIHDFVGDAVSGLGWLLGAIGAGAFVAYGYYKARQLRQSLVVQPRTK
ncbi:MAG: TerC family protein [Rubrobacteraceae bacterium]